MFLAALVSSGIFMIIELIRVNKYASWYLSILPLFFLFSMLGFNRENRDYENYERVFFRGSDTIEFGYGKLVETLRNMGLDHTAIVFLVGFTLIIILLKYLKTNNHLNLVIFFYSTFPLIFDINQTRNTLMYFIIILSLFYVINEKPLKYYLTWFVAFSMHNFAFLYLPFYYLCKLPRKKFIKLLILITIASFIFSPIIVEVATGFLPKMIGYFEKQPRFGPLTLVIYSMVDIFTVWWIDRRISPRLFDKDKRKFEVLYRFIWYPILVIPFAFYFMDFSRLQRNSLLVKFIYAALAMKYMSVKEKFITVILLVISVAIHISVLAYGNELELYEILRENYIQYYLDLYLF